MHSAWLAFIAALVMVGINQMMHRNDATVEVLDHVKVAVKSTILIIILTLGYLNIKKTALSNQVWGLLTLLTISNIVIAVFWG
jgi:hypothetical protein